MPKKVKNKQSLDERVLLGVVGVDSASLLITDPYYIDNLWKRTEQLNLDGLNEYVDIETGKVIEHPHNWEMPYRDDMTYNQALSKGILHKHITDEVKERCKEYSYNGCTANHLSNPLGIGQLCFEGGNAGAGVCFQSGLGDGTYQVWGIIGEVEGWGRRIKKVEIILIPDEE